MNGTLVVHRLRHGHWGALDVAAALLAAAFPAAAHLRAGLLPAIALSALATLAVATRRGWPLPSLAVSLAAAVAALLVGVDSAYLSVASCSTRSAHRSRAGGPSPGELAAFVGRHAVLGRPDLDLVIARRGAPAGHAAGL